MYRIQLTDVWVNHLPTTSMVSFCCLYHSIVLYDSTWFQIIVFDSVNVISPNRHPILFSPHHLFSLVDQNCLFNHPSNWSTLLLSQYHITYTVLSLLFSLFSTIFPLFPLRFLSSLCCLTLSPFSLLFSHLRIFCRKRISSILSSILRLINWWTFKYYKLDATPQRLHFL